MKWLIALMVLTAFSSGMAQEINSTITVNYDALNGTDRQNVVDLAKDIQDYINGHSWTGATWKGPKIQVTMNIYLQSAQNGVYTAQAFVGSQRPIYESSSTSPIVRIMDDSWQFSYTKGQQMVHNEYQFNSLTSFVDYYMYIVLGFDADSYYPPSDPESGTNFYQKASNIVTMGQNSGNSQGWQSGTLGTYSRYGLVNDLLSGTGTKFRQAFFEYEYNGIDLLSTEQDTAQATIVNSLNTIMNIVLQSGSSNVLIREFFNAKYIEIADALKNYPDKSIFQRLSVVDQAHQSTWAKFLN
ncbi:MAG: DUF4835 family protein [Bacteroidetes bacterium]|nr:DUF4835 family protein [Bacteroidota bacterium]